MTEHTATPWHVGMKPGPAVYGPQGEQVIMANNPLIDYQENLANMAHIVKCVNLYDELVRVLQAIVEYEDDKPIEGTKGAEIYQQALDLLAKVKGA